ncbi:hypothetical protein M405DRAFT_827869 [Rhizopogon salebrosus TDB-379]|nr:hypothetical protein M405DRAFT_827869 [Rhizopogon salebrosus TDB-379]
MAFPALALAASILFLMLSLGIACWHSGSWWFQFMATLEAAGLVGAVLLFAWCATGKPHYMLRHPL